MAEMVVAFPHARISDRGRQQRATAGASEERRITAHDQSISSPISTGCAPGRVKVRVQHNAGTRPRSFSARNGFMPEWWFLVVVISGLSLEQVRYPE